MIRVKKGPSFGWFQKIIKRGSFFYEREQPKIPFSRRRGRGKVKNRLYGPNFSFNRG